MAKCIVNHSAGFRQLSSVVFYFCTVSFQESKDDDQYPRNDHVQANILKKVEIIFHNKLAVVHLCFAHWAVPMVHKKIISYAKSNTNVTDMIAGFSLSMLWFDHYLRLISAIISLNCLGWWSPLLFCILKNWKKSFLITFRWK